MRTTVVREFSFDAAHYLPNYKGKCRNMHGHTWRVEVAIEGGVDPKTGMVLDFADLKLLLLPLKDVLDHQVLNESVLENPTAENIAWFISTWVDEHWSELKCLKSMPDYLTNRLNLAWVKVWETPDSYVIVRRGG